MGFGVGVLLFRDEDVGQSRVGGGGVGGVGEDAAVGGFGGRELTGLVGDGGGEEGVGGGFRGELEGFEEFVGGVFRVVGLVDAGEGSVGTGFGSGAGLPLIGWGIELGGEG